MKALVKTKPAPGLEYKDIDIPKIQPDELLVKIYRSSICGSDLPVYNYTGWAPRRIPIPFTPGHELCGTVAEAGPAAKGFKKGDFIAVESHVFCGLCYQCRNNQRHVCANLKVLGLDTQGGYAEYAVVPARCGWKIDEKFKDIGSILEPLGNAVFATLHDDISCKTVLISGCGAQGLFAIDIAKACGAAKVIALETADFRKKMAEQFGADVILDPREDGLLQKIIKAGGEKSGIDAVIEMSGAAAAINLGLKAVKPAGRFTAFGLPGGLVTVDYANDIVFKAIKIQAITGRATFESWYQMDALIKSGKINPGRAITHVFPMKDFEKAFAVMMSPEKNCGKVVMVP